MLKNCINNGKFAYDDYCVIRAIILESFCSYDYKTDVLKTQANFFNHTCPSDPFVPLEDKTC